MKRFLILAVLLPSLACAQTQTTKPQFVPPNGLPLNTPLGTARNADGSGVTTFATMQASIDAAVSPAELTEALTPYLTQSAAEAQYFPLSGGPLAGDVTFYGKIYARGYVPTAPDDKSTYMCADTSNGYLYPANAPCIPSYVDPRYSTPDQVSSAVDAEKTRAMSVEEGLQTGLTNVSENYVSNSDFSTNIAPYLKSADAATTYLTQASADSTYLTQANAASTYLTPSSASGTYLAKSDAASTYLTQTNAASSYLTQAKATSTYLPLTGGSITGNVVLSGYVRILSGGYLWLTNPTQDSNNQNIYISFDATDNSLYFTNKGVQASNYLTSKFNNLKATSLTGTGNAYACVNSAGQFYRSSSACQ